MRVLGTVDKLLLLASYVYAGDHRAGDPVGIAGWVILLTNRRGPTLRPPSHQSGAVALPAHQLLRPRHMDN